MAKHSMPEMKEGSVNVTPLIDVVMCLIIFFMLVAKIGVSTGAVKMELPETIVGNKIETLGATLILNVTYPPKLDASGQPMKDDKGNIIYNEFAKTPIVTALVDQNQGTEPKEIELARGSDHPLRRVLEAKVKLNKDFSVTIRAASNLKYGLLQQVMTEVALAGVKTTNYGAKVRVETTPAPAAG